MVRAVASCPRHHGLTEPLEAVQGTPNSECGGVGTVGLSRGRYGDRAGVRTEKGGGAGGQGGEDPAGRRAGASSVSEALGSRVLYCSQLALFDYHKILDN